MATSLERLRERLGEVHDLQKTGWLLGWDQQTMMPAGGARTRAAQLGTIATVTHQRFIDDETGRLLEAAAADTQGLPPESDEASLVRVARRDWEKARRVPTELAAEMARAAAEGYGIWAEARARNDLAAYLPVLERHLALKHRYIALFPEAAEPYDALFDDAEEGGTAEQIRRVFDRLKEGLIPLVRNLPTDGEDDEAALPGAFPADRQDALCRRLVAPWGFTGDAWRLDTTHHPFCSALATTDVRLTTRYDERDLAQGLFGTLHECGHGLYEAGVDPALERTPLCQGCSHSLHESQSRLWENLVGRGRPFWTYAGPFVREAFPDMLGEMDDDALYRAVNRMRPSLIRVEADELTYSLHIVVRFELELDLLAGRVAVRDIGEAWGAKMREYLGIEVPDHARGVMQDVHWSEGAIGGFPVYALGTVIASQIWERVRAERPELDAEIARGEFGPLRAWLTEHLYRHGRKFTPAETTRMVAGGEIDPEPYLRYLQHKVSELHGPVVA